MARAAMPLDQAACESVIATLQVEWIEHGYGSRDQARLSIFCWIETSFNLRRRHSSLGGIQPPKNTGGRRFQMDYRNRSWIP